MSNTEINSLLEIAKNLESKGLYAQADKAHNIMIRLSAKETPLVVKDLVSDIISEVEGLGVLLAAFGVANFIPFIKKELPLFSSLVNVYVLFELKKNFETIQKLSSKFDWNKFVSGEDPTGAEIADQILSMLSNICMLGSKFIPAFNAWVYIFSGLRTVFNVKRAKQLGYYVGGMPGGEAQIKQIENFDVTTAVNDPYAKQVLHSIVADLGLNSSNSAANVSKLPKILGGLDFFAPYVNKFDTKNKFKDLTSTQPSSSTMEFKKGLVKIMELIRALRGSKGKVK
jgi:hypothetical protein